MFKFGARPPRSLESYGVAGVLGEECQVFYENLFSTRHIGRVSDLLCAKLRETGLDELRLRSVLSLVIFEAYRKQTDQQGKLKQALVIECGIDKEKLAIGVAFVDVQGRIRKEGMGARMAAQSPEGTFEEMLRTVHSHADVAVLKIEPEQRKFEIISILGLPGKLSAGETKVPLEIIQLKKGSVQETPKAGSYTELGDLDYPALLREESPAKALPEARTGEILAKGCTDLKELEDAIRVQSALPVKSEDRIVVSGETAQQEATVLVKGSAAGASDEEVIRVTGGSAQVLDETVLKVPGTPQGPQGNESETELRDQIRTLQEKIAEQEKQIVAFQSGGDDSKQKVGGSRLFGLFRKAWPFRRKKTEETLENSPAAAQDTVGEPSMLQPDSGAVTVPAEENAAPITDSLVKEINEGDLHRTINKAVNESKEMKREIGSERAQRWVDGLMGELVTEKARIQDLAKKISTSMRHKEIQFRNKERALGEELRRRQDALVQRDATIARLKDQLSEITMTLERSKSASKGAVETNHYKHKYAMVQKMLVSLKEENGALRSRVDDFRSKLLAAQQPKSGMGSSEAEAAALRLKLERVTRQCEEFKKSNQQLGEKLAETKKDRNQNGGNIEDLKKKLEAAMRLATSNAKDAEQLQLKLEEAQREEARLKMELNRAQTELRMKGTSGKTNPPQAA
ncbi:MAG TPA: hypothetical protein VJB59_00190 [Bdellovibrionota bacterium]|nr:hypothetical protein [Bdellovibrionota bacterium]